MHSMQVPLEQAAQARIGIRSILRKLPGGILATEFSISCENGPGGLRFSTGVRPALATRVIDPTRNLLSPKGFRHSSGSIRKPGGLERAIEAVAITYPAHAILVPIDSDDDCPKELGFDLRSRAQAARPGLRISLVLAHREYEAWFLASAESMAGKRTLRQDLVSPSEPESIRGAKSWMTKQMAGSRVYAPTQDQAALSHFIDFNLARERSRSFRKLWTEVQALLGVR